MRGRFLAGLVAFSVIGGAGWHHANAEKLVNNYGLEANTIAYTVTFDECQTAGSLCIPDSPLNPGDTITDQFINYGVSFAPGDPGMKFDAQATVLPDGSITDLPAGNAINGNHLGNYFPIQNPFSIIFHTVFATAQTAAAFGLWTQPNSNTTFTALLAGQVVEFFTETTTFDDPASGFYGFVNSTGFDEIRIHIDSSANPPPDDQNLALLDNIQLAAPSDPIPAPVPEPTTLLLFGVAAAWGVRRRRAGMLVN